MEKQWHNLATLMVKQLGLQFSWHGLDSTSACVALQVTWTCLAMTLTHMLYDDMFYRQNKLRE